METAAMKATTVEAATAKTSAMKTTAAEAAASEPSTVKTAAAKAASAVAAASTSCQSHRWRSQRNGRKC